MPDGTSSSPEAPPPAGGPNLSEAPTTPGQPGIEAPLPLPHQTLPDVTHHPFQHGGLEAVISPPVIKPVIGMSERGKPIYGIAGGSDDPASSDESKKLFIADSSGRVIREHIVPPSSEPSVPEEELARQAAAEVAETQEQEESDEHEEVAHTLGEFRKEREDLIEEAERRTLKQLDTEADLEEARVGGDDKKIAELEAKLAKTKKPDDITLDQIRKQAIDEERKRIQKRRSDQALRKSKAEALKIDFEEEEIPEFDEAGFEFEVPRKLQLNQINFTPEEKGDLVRINEKIDKLGEENKESIDFLASPERGVEISETIAFWEGERRKGRYKTIDWKSLNKTYEDQKIHVEAVRLKALQSSRLSRREYREGNPDAPKPIENEKLLKTGFTLGELYQNIQVEIQKQIKEDREGPSEELKELYKKLDIYFEQAKRCGLLTGMDKELVSAYNRSVLIGIEQGLGAREIINGRAGVSSGIAREIAEAQDITRQYFALERRGNPDLERFVVRDDQGEIIGSIWEMYGQLAQERFLMAAMRGDVDFGGEAFRPYMEHEFNLSRGSTENGRERYWRISEIGYAIVYAKTPEQCEIAADTYINNVQSRTSDPQEVFQEVTQFIKQLTQSDGQQSAEFIEKLRERVAEAGGGGEAAKIEAAKKDEDKLRSEFLKGLTHLMQARIGVFSADHANELYHGAQLKQSLDYMAKDGEGPNRWLALMEIHGVAEAIWKMQNDKRFMMLFELYGTNGQLASDTVAQRTRDGSTGLHWQIEHLLVRELLGTRITNNANRKNMVEDRAEREFVEMFDGLYEYGKIPVGHFQGDGYIQLYKKYGYLTERDIVLKIPKESREDYRLGRVQYKLRPKDAEGGGGGMGRHDLSVEDTQVLNRAEARAKKAVHIAMEIYGALGEKSKLGGGVVKVRKIDAEGREYFDFVPIHQGEKLAQTAETLTEIKYADDAEFWRDGIPESMKNDTVGQRIRKAVREANEKADKEYEAEVKRVNNLNNLQDKGLPKRSPPSKPIPINEMSNFKARYRAAMVAQSRERTWEEFAGKEMVILNGAPGTFNEPRDLDANETRIAALAPRDRTEAERAIMLTIAMVGGTQKVIARELTPEEKTVQAKAFEKRTTEEKLSFMKLNIVRIGGKGFEAKLYEYYANGNRIDLMRINRPFDIFDPLIGETRVARKGDLLGYNKNGEQILLNYNEQGELIGLEFDADDKAIIYDRPEEAHRRQINAHLTRNSRAEEKQIPVANSETGETEFKTVLVERAAADFSLATNHIYADWTSHTYWAYQEEDRHELLSEKSFAEARQIREGTMRPEDASVWARQLLILDPTLLRVMRFEETLEEDHERKLVMAAVEHKYQSHWRISRELHKGFIPTFATPVRYNGLYYGLQDFGGYRKMLESVRAQVGEDQERFSRRGKKMTADLHIPYAAGSEMWGRGTGGIMGVMRMFNSPTYRAVGTMALDKHAAQLEVAGKIRSALIENRTSDGKYKEALLLKLTNNSDKAPAALREVLPPEANQYSGKDPLEKLLWEKEPKALDRQGKFAYFLIENNLGRYIEYMSHFALMETGIRNASGAFWFAQDETSAVDIFVNRQFTSEMTEKMKIIPVMTEGGFWNRKQLETFAQHAKELDEMIERASQPRINTGSVDDVRSPSTGSGRHSAEYIHARFGELLVDREMRGGGQNYPGEVVIFSRIYDDWLIVDPNDNTRLIPSGTIWDFIGTKIFPT